MQLFNNKELEPYVSSITGNKVYPVKVDIKSGIKGSKQIIFSGGDINTATISILFYDDVDLYDISNKTIVANIIKPDNEKMTVTGVPSGKYVEFNLGATGVKQEGIYTLDIEFVWDGKLITTPKFSYKTVLPVDISKELGQDENFPILVQLIMSVEEKIGEMDNKIVELESFKSEILEDIDNYKTLKDSEITQNLNQVKTETKQEITDFKNTKSSELEEFKELKNSEIDSFKTEKDLEITEFKDTVTEEITSLKTTSLEEIKSLKDTTTKEITKFKEQKSSEIDAYKLEKDKLIDSKILEVTQSKDNMVQQANNKISELEEVKLDLQGTVNGLVEESTATIQGLVQEADLRIEELVGYEEEINNLTSTTNEHATRLNSVEYKNKVQDTFLNGLFNENKDGRLTINGEGNTLKLEGSKKGIVEVESIEGDTLVNIGYKKESVKGEINEEGQLTLFFENTNQEMMKNFYSRIKKDTKYTVVLFNKPEFVNQVYLMGALGTLEGNRVAVTISSDTYAENFLHFYGKKAGATLEEFQDIDFIILEGDYTSKPLPNYFEGMKSSFEEHKITEEDVREGLELQDNLGKYKCNVKVVGKNLLDVKYLEDKTNWVNNLNAYISIPINLKPNTQYTFSCDSIKAPKQQIALNVATKVWEGVEHENNGIFASIFNTTVAVDIKTTDTFTTTDSTEYYLQYFVNGSNYSNYEVDDQWFTRITKNIMLEEGSVATEYEPYTESNQVVYLNSPLLKGDKIVYKEDGLYHYHHSGEVTISEEQLILNPSTVETLIKFIVIDTVPNIAKGIFRKVVCNNFPSYEGGYISFTEEGIIQWADDTASFVGCISKSKLSSEDLEGVKRWFRDNPTTVIYELKEPFYEKILDSKFVIDIPNNATLTFDNVIPCTDIKASYTGNIPSVYEIEETGINNSLDIEVTQQAVDFLLMSTVSGFSINKYSKGGSNMGAYFASRILKGALDYREVVEKYPEFKEDIDFILKSEGREDLIKR